MFGGVITGVSAAWIPPQRLARIRAQLSARDDLITEVLLCTGFRLDDIMHCRVWQLRQPQLRLAERKTGKLRTVQLPDQTRARLDAQLHGRVALAYAFPALRHGGRRKQHRSTYWRHFAAAVRAAGYADCAYTPHSLRKCYAVDALRRTHSLAAVQRDLGHASAGTTAIYALSAVLGDEQP